MSIYSEINDAKKHIRNIQQQLSEEEDKLKQLIEIKTRQLSNKNSSEMKIENEFLSMLSNGWNLLHSNISGYWLISENCHERKSIPDWLVSKWRKENVLYKEFNKAF